MYNKRPQGWLKHIDFIFLDLLVLQLSYIIAYWFRLEKWNLFSVEYYRNGALTVLAAQLFLAVFTDHYKNILKRNSGKELQSVIRSVLFSVGALLTYLFFAKKAAAYSRISVLYYAIAAFCFLFVERTIWKKVLLARRNRDGYHRKHLMLICDSRDAAHVITKIKKDSLGEYKIIGIVPADQDGSLQVGDMVEDVPVVAELSGVIDYIRGIWLDELLICLPEGKNAPEEILEKCAVMGITTHTALNLDTSRNVMRDVEKVGGFLVLTESIRIASTWQLLIKRIMDILGSIVGLILTAILTIIIGPLIYFSDPGPIFFKQKRIGKNGRVFTMYKFRSMYQDAEARKKDLMEKNEIKGLMFKMEHDPRILGSGPDGTNKGIGWFIRKTSIDEFPQFAAVLTGKLSLVGTRPPTLDEWEHYDLHHRARMSIRPGLTGMWQVSGRSEITDFEDVIALDMEYINNWTIWEDIRIILKTVMIVITGGGAK